MYGSVAVAALVLIATLATPLSAADFQAGWDAYQRGDFATALKEWRPLAEQGHAYAQHSLGFMYYEGHGVPQDDGEAVKWFRRAAEQGNATAQHSLGIIYDNGEGIPQDYGEAVKWYRRAADQGHSRAQLNLCIMYGIGRGVAQDHAQAHMWCNLAAAGSPPGKLRDAAVEVRDHAETFMTPAQVIEAQRLAREWKPKAQAGN